MFMGDCDFCNIIDNPHEGVIAESEHAIAFMDKHPIAPGHCLVTTRKHHESLMEVSDRELLGLFKLVAKVEKALLRAGLGEGVDLRQHFRPFLPEGKYVKRHVHVHIVPRFEGDGFKHWRGTPYGKGKDEAVAKKIRAALKR